MRHRLFILIVLILAAGPGACDHKDIVSTSGAPGADGNRATNAGSGISHPSGTSSDHMRTGSDSSGTQSGLGGATTAPANGQNDPATNPSR